MNEQTQFAEIRNYRAKANLLPICGDDPYPSDEELEVIEKWPYLDVDGLLEFVKPRFRYSNESGWCSWHRRGPVLRLHTGGWSGNESIMESLQRNVMFWSICWRTSRRGGHYSFEIPDWEARAKQNAAFVSTNSD